MSKYMETKKGSLEESILGLWQEAAKKQTTETNKNDKSDDGEGLDAVQPKAVKKKFKDRKDKDIDNDGDVDSSDEFLHKKRKAISKSMAKETKKEILILWTDYFKPVHLETYPDLHQTIWKAAKLCSACKVNIDLAQAEELMSYVEKIHNIFWASKGRSDAFVKAS